MSKITEVAGVLLAVGFCTVAGAVFLPLLLGALENLGEVSGVGAVIGFIIGVVFVVRLYTRGY